jgi:cysteine desulfurase/selenocysteine lyase
MSIDVKELGVDFLAFSGHKSLGPTGVGVLWGRAELLETLPPFLFGGSMVSSATMTDATWAPVPRKFEAGVPNMAQAVGLGAALEYLEDIGLENIHEHEIAITGRLLEGLATIEGVTVFGPTNLELRGGTVSFTLEGVHPHDVAQILDRDGIAVRAGHHCAQPLHEKFGIPATSRASFYLYNTKEEVDLLVNGIYKVKEMFG